MKSQNSRKRYPLHIHIATLFTILILIVATALAWFGYRQISQLAFDTTEILFSKTADELALQFQAEYRPVSTSVRLLANAAISEARDLEERMQYTPLLAEIISNEPQIAGFHIGYADGDFFLMFPLQDDRMRALFAAPDDAVYVVNHVSHSDSGENRQVRIFLAEQLEPVGEPVLGVTDFDPRSRPWYQTAESSGIVHITSPYVFTFAGVAGITISKFSPRGDSTVAASTTLDSLTEILRKNKITASTFSLLFNAGGEVLSHDTDGIGSPFEKVNDKQIPGIGDLPEPLVDITRQLAAQPGQVLPFTYNDERWFGSVRELGAQNHIQISLLIAAPERELLAAAFEARRTSIIITVIVILLALPVAWFTANLITRPMRMLASEARDIAGFDFSLNISVDTIMLEVDQLARSMDTMRVTIGNFFRLITSISGESDIDRLLDRVTDETMLASSADAAVIYLLDDNETELNARPARLINGEVLVDTTLPNISLGGSSNRLLDSFLNQEVVIEKLGKGHSGEQPLQPLVAALGVENLTTIVLPLANRDNAGSGLLCLLYSELSPSLESALSPEYIGFTQALSGFAAVSMESRQLLKMQKILLQSFIELIASAIDAKSPYTGGHCQRVPELTKNACRSRLRQPGSAFQDFFAV